MSTSLATSRAARFAAALSLTAVVMLACSGAAFAATSYTNATPAPNSTVAAINPPIQVSVSDPAGLNASSLIFKLNGVKVGARLSGGVVRYQPASLKNGAYTASCSLLNWAGVRSTYNWNFTVAAKPVLGPLAPADGVTVSSQSPEISAVVSPNGVAISSWSMVLDGAPVAATYDGFTKKISYTPPAPLQNDQAHTATLSVTDASGTSSSVTWTFSVQIYADMINSAACVDCHWDYPAVHTMTNCDNCHGYDGPVGGFYGSPDYHPEGEASLFLQNCTSCHNGTYPTVPMHGDLTVAHRTASDMSGCACHVRSLSIEHNRWTLESGQPIACTSCHGQGASQAVKDALASGQTQCLACHTISDTHPYGEIDHVADVGETVEATGGFVCSDCHQMDLSTEHAKGSSSSVGQNCATCHPQPRESFGAWDQTCAQGGCHATGSPTAVHGNISAAHAYADPNASCLAAGCHGGPADLAAMHTGASATTADGTYTSCLVCHANGVPTTKDCATCHPDRVTPHGYDAAMHTPTSPESAACQGAGCHPSTDVGPLHAARPEGQCAVCHANPTKGDLTAGKTSANCEGCHITAGVDFHVGYAASHTAAAAAGNVSVGMNNDYHSTGDTGYFNCSDCHITNLLSLHVNNCGACHASSNSNVNNAVSTGNTSCTACHPSQHYGEVAAHQAEYDAGNYDCGWCHGSGCYCHGPHTPVPVPTTTTDLKPAYEGDATIHLIPSDGETGEFGIKATYYIVDGGATQTGKTISVAAPTSGTASHTLQYWSTDWSGNTEAKHSASFTVSKDVVPPTTTSDVKASYVGPVTIKLTATDGSQAGVAHTYYSIDGGAATEGLTVNLAQPATGTASHTLSFWSVDAYGNPETPKSASFTVTADLVAPTTTMTSSNYFRSTWTSFNFTSSDPAPSSGLASYYALVDGLPTNVYGPYDYGNGNWAVTCYIPGGGTHTLSFWAKDKSGNTELAKTATVIYDATAPTTTDNALTSYVGTANITLTATDGGSGVAYTRWRYYNATTGTWYGYYTGTAVSITGPASGTSTYYLYYYSADNAGNTSGQTVRTFTISAPGSDGIPPTGTMSVNSGAAYTGTTAATVNSAVTDNVGVTQMHIDPGTGTYGAWIAYAASSPITLPAGTGTKTVRAQYRDAIGNMLTLTDTIVLDQTAPTGTMSVNNGAAYTNLTSVNVNSSVSDAASGISQMCVDPGTGTYGPWVAYAASWPISLSGADGTKTVRVQYRDNVGNLLTLTDTIVLDATAPYTTVNITPDQIYLGSQIFTLSPTDSGGTGVAGTWWQLDGTGGAWTSGTSVNVPQPASGTQSHTLYWYSRDLAGNVELQKQVSFSIQYQATTSFTTSFSVGTTAWMDVDPWASGPWANFQIYADGVLIGTKDANDGTTTWNCPGVNVSSGARIDIVQNVGWVSANQYDWNTPITSTFYLPAGSTRLEAATWTGFSTTRADWAYDGWDWGYPENDYQYVALDPCTVGNVVYASNAGPDTTAPTGTISVAGGAAYTSSLNVLLTLSASDAGGSGVQQMQFSNDNAAWSGWNAYTTSFSWPLSAVDGAKTVYVRYKDGAGNISSAYSDGITLDRTGPTGTMSVNSGAAYTGTTLATVNSSVSDATSGISQMRINPGTGTYGSWVAYNASAAITLPAGSGTKTVGVQYRDAAGNVTTLTDTIVLDQTAPTGTMSVNNGANYTNLIGVNINASVGDALSGVTQMSVDPGTGTFGSWIGYNATYPITLTVLDGTKTIRVQYRDAVGNILTLTDTIVLDATAPYTTVNITQGQTYAGNQTFTLSPTDIGGSGVVGTWWSLDSATGPWTSGVSVPVAAPTSGTASRTLYWYSRDVAGNQETTKTVSFVMTAGAGTATLAFRWEGMGYADLHIEDSYGNIIASTHVEGSGTALNWYYDVPAGQAYRMVADYWWDDEAGYDGSGDYWTPTTVAGQTYEWWY